MLELVDVLIFIRCIVSYIVL